MAFGHDRIARKSIAAGVISLMFVVTACADESPAESEPPPTKRAETQQTDDDDAQAANESAEVEVETEEAEPDDTLPPSIHTEIFWGGGGAGSTPPDACLDGEVVFWLSTSGGKGLTNGDPKHPYFGAPPPEEGVYGIAFHVNQCNLPDGTQIDATFVLPTGERLEKRGIVTDGRSTGITWISIPGEPVGSYNVEVSGLEYEEVLPFEISRASFPIVHVWCNGDGPGQHILLLTGFAPDERVLVLRYTEQPFTEEELANLSELPFGVKWTLADYEYFTMDDNGAASIALTGSEGIFVAVGENPEYFWGNTNDFEHLPADGFDEVLCLND